MVVEDEADYRVLLREFLGKAGYAVFEASTGEKGLELFQPIRTASVRVPRVDGEGGPHLVPVAAVQLLHHWPVPEILFFNK